MHLPPNQTQQPTLPDITASADFMIALAGRSFPPSHQNIYCYSPPSAYITRPKQLHLTSLKQ